jgi:hypothetical protein
VFGRTGQNARRRIVQGGSRDTPDRASGRVHAAGLEHGGVSMPSRHEPVYDATRIEVGATANLDGRLRAPPLGCHAGMGKRAMCGIATLDNKCKDRRFGTNLDEATRFHPDSRAIGGE